MYPKRPKPLSPTCFSSNRCVCLDDATVDDVSAPYLPTPSIKSEYTTDLSRRRRSNDCTMWCILGENNESCAFTSTNGCNSRCLCTSQNRRCSLCKSSWYCCSMLVVCCASFSPLKNSFNNPAFPSNTSRGSAFQFTLHPLRCSTSACLWLMAFFLAKMVCRYAR